MVAFFSFASAEWTSPRWWPAVTFHAMWTRANCIFEHSSPGTFALDFNPTAWSGCCDYFAKVNLIQIAHQMNIEVLKETMVYIRYHEGRRSSLGLTLLSSQEAELSSRTNAELVFWWHHGTALVTRHPFNLCILNNQDL